MKPNLLNTPRLAFAARVLFLFIIAFGLSAVPEANAQSKKIADESVNVGSIADPTFDMSFPTASVALNTSSQLSFTIRNQDQFSALTGMAFTLNLPAGLVVSSPPNGTGSCGGGTLTAVAGSSVISLSGGSLAANTECNFSFSILATIVGFKALSASLTANGLLNPAEGKTSVIVFAPTSAGATVSGMVISPEGRGLANAQVSVIDGNGVVRSVRTNQFGHFRFDGLPAGEGYTFDIRHKLYTFEPLFMVINEDLGEIIFAVR